ncbi:MIZ/SP-RING zinc finger-domain-containing protein, partial [Mycena sanguinolenta]
LVKTTPVSALVNTLRKTCFVSAEDARKQMLASMVKDDDIIAGSLKVSLRCPLSFTRITTPSRSTKCTHAQCFDAGAWFAVMEQTTTWLCPVCEKVLDWRELIVEGLFLEILKSTPDTVDDVLLEADGGWRIANSLAPVSASVKKVELAAAQGQDVYYVDSDSEGEGE